MYRFTAISPSYRNQLVDASSYAYSICGNTIEAHLFQLTANNLYSSWELRVDHFIKTGTYLIVVNKKTNIIVGGCGFVDLCDYGINYENDLNDNKRYPSNVADFDKSVVYAYNLFANKNNEFKKLWDSRYNEFDKSKYIHYSKWCCPGLWWSSPETRNKGISLFIRYLNKAILVGLGYKYSFTDVVNRTAIKFSFKSGDKLEATLPLNTFNQINFKKYIDDLKYKFNYNNKQIEKLKKLSVFIIVAYHHKYENNLDLLYQHVDIFFNQYKMSLKNRSKM